jgi:hypothetical protein
MYSDDERLDASRACDGSQIDILMNFYALAPGPKASLALAATLFLTGANVSAGRRSALCQGCQRHAG